MKIGTQY